MDGLGPQLQRLTQWVQENISSDNNVPSEKSELTNEAKGYNSYSGGYGGTTQGHDSSVDHSYGAETGGHGTLPNPKKEDENCHVM